METVYIKFIYGSYIWHFTTHNVPKLEEYLLKIVLKYESNVCEIVNDLSTSTNIKIQLTTQYNNEDLAYCIMPEYFMLGVIEKTSLHLSVPIVNKIIHF